MTPAQRHAYHLQYIRWHTGQERIARRIVLARLRRMADNVSVTVEKAGATATIGTLDFLITDAAHQGILEAIYLQVGVLAAEREYNRLLPPKKSVAVAMLAKDRDAPELPKPGAPKPSGLLQVGFQSQTWRERMVSMARSSETALRITSMTAKTKQLVRDTLTRGAEQNWSLPRLVRGLRSVIVSKVRATLIARTETTRAANAGHEQGAMSTLLKLDKIWIATSDTRTRDAHRAMIGSKPVPRDGFFLVGGAKMRFPGDPAGGASNTCRCRCVVSYVPSKDRFNLN